MTDADIWVFGYGSLIWDPGFESIERSPAVLRGYRRAMCIYSHVWRGTPASPGLVLGLDRGGSCRGLAFRIEGGAAEEVLHYLDGRERVTEVYVRRRLHARLPDGRKVPVETYIADRGHPQYAGTLPLDMAARLVRGGRGRGGDNLGYLEATVSHLDGIGMPDRALERLLDAVKGPAGEGGA